MGGAGSAVAEALAAAGIVMPMLHLGLHDRFIDHGDPAQLLATADSTPRGIARRCASRPGLLASDGAPRATRSAQAAAGLIQFQPHEPSRAIRCRCSRCPTCSRQRRRASGDRPGRHQGPAVPAAASPTPTASRSRRSRVCNLYVALPEDRQGHPHVAAGRAARGAAASRHPPLTVAGLREPARRSSSRCSRRPAAGSSSRSRSS